MEADHPHVLFSWLPQVAANSVDLSCRTGPQAECCSLTKFFKGGSGTQRAVGSRGNSSNAGYFYFSFKMITAGNRAKSGPNDWCLHGNVILKPIIEGFSCSIWQWFVRRQCLAHYERGWHLQWRRKGSKQIQSMAVIPVMRSPRDGREEDRACQQKLEQLRAPERGARTRNLAARR